MDFQGCQIINYRVSDDGKWAVCIGITQQQGRVVGAMQLYSRDRGISQAIEGHAAAFGTLRLEGAPADTKVFTFAVRTATGAKLHIVEVDHQASNPVFAKKAVDVYFRQKLLMISLLPCRYLKSTASSTLSQNTASSTFTTWRPGHVSS